MTYTFPKNSPRLVNLVIFTSIVNNDDCLIFQLENGGEEQEREEGPVRDAAIMRKAFRKWQDHRPSFAEMHSEDHKRRPRSYPKQFKTKHIQSEHFIQTISVHI